MIFPFLSSKLSILLFLIPNQFLESTALASAAAAAAVNPNGIKTLLGYSVLNFFINCKQTFVNVPRSL